MDNFNENAQNINNSKYFGTPQLLATEEGLIRYSTSIVRKFHRKLDLKTESKILEFGAGTGFLATIFRSKYQIVPDCVELDPELSKLIRSKGFFCCQFISELSSQYDAIYTSNVLEHIEEDEKILVELHKIIKPMGLIGIYVPAHQLLFSEMDVQVGHLRRYSKSELSLKVESAGFHVECITYDDFLGFFASMFVKVVGYDAQTKLGSSKTLEFYDKIIYPVSRILDFCGFRHILGKNILLVARKVNA